MCIYRLKKLLQSRINRTALSEAKQQALQVWLGMQTTVGESLCKLLLRLILKEALRDVLMYLISLFNG